MAAHAPSLGASDTPSTVKLLSELERSWAMFSASWAVVDLFGGLQIYQQTTSSTTAVRVCCIGSRSCVRVGSSCVYSGGSA